VRPLTVAARVVMRLPYVLTQSCATADCFWLSEQHKTRPKAGLLFLGWGRYCNMNRIPLAFFTNSAKAEPLQRRLREVGIGAEIHDELRLEKLWFVSKPESGARLEAPAEEYERAMDLLLGWDASERALGEAIRCPECKSFRVEYPQFTRKFLIPNLALGPLSALGLVEKEYYCQDCHFTWPKEGRRQSKLRPNMAPYYFIEGVEQTTLRLPQAEPTPDEHKRAA